jgi:hypothetical protein
MLNFYKKLSLVVLSGALTLGLSPMVVAKGDFVATNWLFARQQLDCPMTCRSREMTVIAGGLDQKERKPISVCTTRKHRKRMGGYMEGYGEWLVGYNRWKENTCNVTLDGQEFRGERYYCLCTTHMLQPLR